MVAPSHGVISIQCSCGEGNTATFVLPSGMSTDSIHSWVSHCSVPTRQKSGSDACSVIGKSKDL
eukprot:6217384-Amphidinium_carterae.1